MSLKAKRGFSHRERLLELDAEEDAQAIVKAEGNSDEDESLLDPSNMKAHSRPSPSVKTTTPKARTQHASKEDGSLLGPSNLTKQSKPSPRMKSGATSKGKTQNGSVFVGLEKKAATTAAETTFRSPPAKKAEATNELRGTGSGKIMLSPWATRFLQKGPATKQLEEPPIIPLNDYILSDFSARSKRIAMRERSSSSSSSSSSDEEAKEEEKHDVPIKKVGGLSESEEISVGASEGEDGQEESEEKDPTKSKKGKAGRVEHRYFREVLGVKCYKCKQVGHIAMFCPNDRVNKPCYLCAKRDHDAAQCPDSLCFRCLEPGHQVRECPNQRLDNLFCRLCGRSDHLSSHCRDRRVKDRVFEEATASVRCMACWTLGHTNCTPLPVPKDNAVYCCNCGEEGHTKPECEEPSYEESLLTFGLSVPGPRSFHENKGRETYQRGPQRREMELPRRRGDGFARMGGGRREAPSDYPPPRGQDRQFQDHHRWPKHRAGGGGRERDYRDRGRAEHGRRYRPY